MKIGIFIDNFYQTQAEKDPGIIGTFLAKKYEVAFYCFNTDLRDFENVPVKKISQEQAEDSLFWKEENNDYIIFYSWLSLKFSRIIKALNKNNSGLILKMDSDGHLIFPLRPTYLRTGLDNYSFKSLLLFIFRRIQWFILPRLISEKKIAQIKNCDAIMIESPQALANLQESLKYWGLEAYNTRIFFVPNPIKLPDEPRINKKENTVISVGRWYDKRKNGAGIVKILSQLNDFPDWNFVLIGNGSARLKDKIGKKNKHISLVAFESLPHNELLSIFEKAKICLAPSICESFGIAAAEALGCGCSLVATPLESFDYLSNKSQFGTLAKNFSPDEIRRALVNDIKKWQHQAYNPADISHYIKTNLNPEAVGAEIEKVMETI